MKTPNDALAPAVGSARPHLDTDSCIEVCGHQLTLFVESGPLIDSMVESIRSARQRVWLESYIVADDAAGRAVADALIDRAGAGVDVRLMYDAAGSYETPWSFFDRLSEAGVKVHAFHTFTYAIKRWSLIDIFNRRNHRKLLVVDDKVAYFGGMNIVDQSGIDSPDDASKRHLPTSAGWRDLHVKLVGPQQANIAASMDNLWCWARHEPIHRWPKWPLESAKRCTDEGIFLFDCRPQVRHRRAARVFTGLMRRAKRTITLSMAYFIPYGSVLRALLKARKRGVEVRVVVPEKSDVAVVEWATRHYYDRLLKYGIKIFERLDHMLHSKVMVIDDEWSLIGSCNLDPRSLRTNLEFLGVIRSKALAQRVNEICAYEIEHSRRVCPEDLKRQNAYERLRGRLAWSMRKWL